jgi:hypothetical protein
VTDSLAAENVLLRQLLWACHGCPPGTQYGTDGELQCAGFAGGHRIIDFKRDPALSIQATLQEPSLRFIQEHQDDRCRHCGRTRWTWDATSPCSGDAHDWVTESKPEGTES